MNVFQPERTTALLSRIIIKSARGRPEEEEELNQSNLVSWALFMSTTIKDATDRGL